MRRLLSLTVIVATFSWTQASARDGHSYDPSGYIKSQESSRARETAPAVDAKTGRKTFNCKPEAPTQVEVDASAGGAVGAREVVESSGDEVQQRHVLPSGQDMAKAAVKSARDNCKRETATKKTKISVTVSRPESEASAPGGVRTIRPAVGVSKSF